MSSSASKLKKKANAILSRGGPGPDRSEVGAHGVRVEPGNPHAEVEDGGKVDPPAGYPRVRKPPLFYLALSNGPFGRRR